MTGAGGRVRELTAVGPERPSWQAPWPLVCVAAALGTALVGWLPVVGMCLIGWISVPQLPGGDVFRLATQGWLLAHGIPVSLPGAWLSIPPLGLTAVAIVAGLGGCRFAVWHGRAPSDPGKRPRRAVQMGCVIAVAYLVVLLAARAWVGTPAPSAGLAPVVVLVFALGVGGCAHSLAWDPLARLPGRWAWARAIVPSVSAGLCVMVVAGALVFAAAVVSGHARVSAIHNSLSPGVIGGAMLILVQLGWLPNYILWCGSWAAGAGIQLGAGTVVSPAQSFVGMLPAIPVMGAVPPAGPAPGSLLAWVASGLVAGAGAAYVLVRALERSATSRGRRLGPGAGAIAGALIGVATGLVFLVLELPASGNLGSARLVGIGARMGTLAIMAPSSMGVAGMAAGWLAAWLAARRPAPATADAADEQSTRIVADTRSSTGGAG